MSLSGFIVLYAVIWFIAFWCILPIGLRTQGDDGQVVHGTPQSAPNNLRLGRKLMWTTVVGTLVWLPIVLTIWLSGISIQDIDPMAWLMSKGT